jgi:dihydroflavonol-4-reductase
MSGCHAVIHAAGYYPLYSIGREQQARHAILELRNVLMTAYECGVQRFVFTSSPMVLVEDPNAFRRCTYHYIKKLMHDEVLRWIDGHFPAVLAMPGACFGPGDRKPTTGRLILEIARRRLRFIVEGKMNAVDGRDVAVAEVEMLYRGAIGESYQLGNWNCMASDFAALVAELSGVPKPTVQVSYEAIRLIARTVEIIEYPFGIAQPLVPESGFDQVHYGVHLDSSPAQRDLGFRTRPIEKTVRETIQYFQKEGMLSLGIHPSHQRGVHSHP